MENKIVKGNHADKARMQQALKELENMSRDFNEKLNRSNCNDDPGMMELKNEYLTMIALAKKGILQCAA